jgi:hypothetical protein
MSRTTTPHARNATGGKRSRGIHTITDDFLSVPSLAPSPQQLPAQAALTYPENTLIDPHFYERDNMGRTVTFQARIVEDPQWSPPSTPGGPSSLPGTMAIGIDS